LYRNGAKILAGTDFPLFYLVPGLSIHQELELFVDFGFSNFDALKTATTNPAEWSGNAYNKGYLSKGKQADLIILNKNPLDNIKNTQSIYMVIFKGQIVQEKPSFFFN
jgi:imidazolonepropionase-like amidohydrolase